MEPASNPTLVRDMLSLPSGSCVPSASRDSLRSTNDAAAMLALNWRANTTLFAVT